MASIQQLRYLHQDRLQFAQDHVYINLCNFIAVKATFVLTELMIRPSDYHVLLKSLSYSSMKVGRATQKFLITP